MTISKAQGQSLQRVGVYLPCSVFSHGQLYVAASRVGSPEHIMFLVKGGRKEGLQRVFTKNQECRVTGAGRLTGLRPVTITGCGLLHSSSKCKMLCRLVVIQTSRFLQTAQSATAGGRSPDTFAPDIHSFQSPSGGLLDRLIF